MSAEDLDIEPDVVEGEVLDAQPPQPTANFMPPGFPLATLLRFMPDIRLKHAVTKAADALLAIDVKAPDGLQKADSARAKLATAIAAAEKPFEDPTGWANQLHKRLTGLRSDFTKYGAETLKAADANIYAETKRRERLAEEDRRRRQEEADREAKAHAEKLAKDAAKRKASPDVVEALREEAKTATAPPVTSFALSVPLSKSTPVEKWKGRFVGTPDGDEVNPDMADLSPEQQQHAREFFAAVGAGKVSLACAAVNWAEINRRAHADRRTFDIAGMEAVDVGGLRSKGKR